LTDLKKKLEISENKLNEYLKKNEIVSVPGIDQKAQGLLDNLKQERLNTVNQISELSRRYKPKHPKMISMQGKLATLDASIADETAKSMVLNEKMVDYGVLKREVESNKYLYESLLRRIKETEVSKNLESTNITIIDLADVPKAPFSPNRKRDIYTGATIGLFIGLCFAFLLEYLDSTVKNAEDIESYLKLPFLGYVPSAKHEAKTGKEIDVICQRLPASRIAEAYRSIRTSIIFSATEDKPLSTILITSTSPEEGKTTVSLNLGIVFASANEKTLIIEADMRRPRIAKSLGLQEGAGLSSFLAGTTDLAASIQETFVPNLFLMSSGPRPPNPAELLTSTKTRQLIEEAKTKFDRIIIDSSPILTVADSAILANKVDGVIDVVRASFQNIDLILRGRQRLSEVKARSVGVILNNVNVKKEDSYYYYHYYYSDKKET
jgi:polysaccharide biosynthesis transport protein